MNRIEYITDPADPRIPAELYQVVSLSWGKKPTLVFSADLEPWDETYTAPITKQAVQLLYVYSGKTDKIISGLAAEILDLEKSSIWGYYEEEYPVYTSLQDAAELSEPMTVIEANGLIDKLKKLDAENKRLKDSVTELNEILDDLRYQMSMND